MSFTRKGFVPNEQVQKWNDKSYREKGFGAQRKYPNEELLRFMGRNYFGLSPDERKNTKILEIGCGSGANLWMIAKEGFEAYGIDLAEESVPLCKQMLQNWGTKATVQAADMLDIPYAPGTFDAIVDVLASYCLTEAQFEIFLDGEVKRLLKPGGTFFSYTPSKNSDAFKNHAPSTLLDSSTLDGIQRKTSAYYGDMFPFRFTAPKEYQKLLEFKGFKVTHNEVVGRTYRGREEYFEYVVMTAQKQQG